MPDCDRLLSPCPHADNGYYFPYNDRYRGRRDTSVSLVPGHSGPTELRRKDPVLLLPWWKEILGTIVFCIAATTYIVRKFFHPPAASVRVRSCFRWSIPVPGGPSLRVARGPLTER